MELGGKEIKKKWNEIERSMKDAEEVERNRGGIG
jgi:hypothetical protein